MEEQVSYEWLNKIDSPDDFAQAFGRDLAGGMR